MAGDNAVLKVGEGDDGRTWLLVDLSEGWTVAYRLVGGRSRPEIAELRVVPTVFRDTDPEWSGSSTGVPEGGLTARVLREVRVQEHLGLVGSLRRAASSNPDDDPFNRHQSGLDVGVVSNRPGRAGRSDLFLARVAARYVDLIDDGSRKPVQDLAAALRAEGNDFTIDGVRGFLHDARKRGLLTSPPKGRYGGDLTERAEQLLVDGVTSRMHRFTGDDSTTR